jgi:phage terminase large subunit GpA-like protein
VAADRKKDADRKRAAREVAAKLRPEPAALPSAVPSATPAPANGLAVAPGSAVDPAFVPWQADIIKPLVEDLLQAAEDGRVAQFAAKCKQLGDMPKLVKEIEADAHFPKAAKVLLTTSLPRLAAKWLNKSGISAEYQDELAVATAILLIIKHDRSTNAKLDELIAQTKSRKTPESKQEQVIFGSPAPAAKTEPTKEASPAAALSAPQQIATVRQ